MMVKWSVANSSSGALVITTRCALLAGGRIWAAPGLEESRLPSVVVITSVRRSLFMDVLVPLAFSVERLATMEWAGWGEGGRRRKPLAKADAAADGSEPHSLC